jgi:hypothetical protein
VNLKDKPTTLLCAHSCTLPRILSRNGILDHIPLLRSGNLITPMKKRDTSDLLTLAIAAFEWTGGFLLTCTTINFVLRRGVVLSVFTSALFKIALAFLVFVADGFLVLVAFAICLVAIPFICIALILILVAVGSVSVALVLILLALSLSGFACCFIFVAFILVGDTSLAIAILLASSVLTNLEVLAAAFIIAGATFQVSLTLGELILTILQITLRVCLVRRIDRDQGYG